MSDKLTHIKKLRNPNYIGSYELLIDDDKSINLDVTITGWKQEEVQNSDQKKEIVTILELKDQKPFILNVTNENDLTKLFKTPFIEKWIGRSFTLCVKKIRVGGKPTYALRIVPELPKAPKQELKEFGPDNPKWNDAIEALKKGTATVDALKETRKISPENEEILRKAESESIL